MYLPNSKWTWSFFLVGLVQALIALALEAYVFAKFQNSLIPAAKDQGGSDVRTIPTYLALLIFGFIYQMLLVWDALRQKNTIQIIMISFMNLAIMVYTAIQIDQIQDADDALKEKRLIDLNFWNDVRPYLISLPILTSLGTIVMGFISYKLYGEFAWTIYKQISADLRMKKRFLIYQIYIALLKIDFFLFLGFVIQFLVIVRNTTDAEFYLTVAALPVILCLLLLAAWSTQRENFPGMILTILVYFVALVYFIFKLVRMYTAGSKRLNEYKPARTTLTVFAVITIVFLVVTIIIACWCTHNFNKGLKNHVSRSAKTDASQGDKLYGMGDVSRPGARYEDGIGGGHGYGVQGAPGGGSRMEID